MSIVAARTITSKKSPNFPTVVAIRPQFTPSCCSICARLVHPTKKVAVAAVGSTYEAKLSNAASNSGPRQLLRLARLPDKPQLLVAAFAIGGRCATLDAT